jgi:DNA processing protein
MSGMIHAMGSGRSGNDSLATLLLTQHLIDSGAKPFRPAEYWAIAERLGGVGRLLGTDGEQLARDAGVQPVNRERIAKLVEQATGLAFELDRLEQSGITALTAADDGYPIRLRERLGDTAPPVLFAAGDVSLLTGEAIAIVGSRNIQPAAARVAREIAATCAHRGLTVISGGARGVDQLAMNAAIETGGSVVGVLADALASKLKDPDIRRAISTGHVCLATPYKPTMGFTVANAMNRNKIIYALSTRAVVVASDLGEGGTWTGAMESLRKGLTSVMAWTGDGAGPGNTALVRQGALEMRSVSDLFAGPGATEQTRQEQISLELG